MNRTIARFALFGLACEKLTLTGRTVPDLPFANDRNWPTA